MTKVLGIIPSRLQSSRLPNKPLHKIFDIALVEHVYRRAILCKELDDLIVATDSQEIVDLIESIGGKAMLTSPDHKNGTERMGEVMDSISADYYTLINGDEILLNPDSISESIKLLKENPNIDASMLAVPFTRENSYSDFKIVLNALDEVMYISRNDIPSSSRNPVSFRLKAYHLMTFRPETLQAYRGMDKSAMEKIEDHEHLRLIENGFKIGCKVVNDGCISLDTSADLPFIEEYLKKDDVFKRIVEGL